MERALLPAAFEVALDLTGRDILGRGWEFTDIGRVLIAVGLVLLIAGVLLTIVGRAHLPLGRLPGDIVYRGKNTTIYFPLATSVLLSVVLSIVLYVVGRWRK